eukprot:c8566_g1_i1.p1 GENE.c8566_g1_i1~~c8566_g1_i1.p1  ORF type:complete len:425 (-),score=63.38 c8566_g1_i1:80-1243(-)
MIQSSIQWINQSKISTLRVQEPELPPRRQRVLIAVCSSPDHFRARQAIRDAWIAAQDANIPARPSPSPLYDPHRCAIDPDAPNCPSNLGVILGDFEVGVRFFIGRVRASPARDKLEQLLAQEAIASRRREVGLVGTGQRLSLRDAGNSDIVRLPELEESYSNLSNKTFMMISWAFENSFDHVMKIDDDTFLHFPRLVSMLAKLPSVDDAYAGVIHRNFPVISNSKSKWYMSDQYSESIFPPYAAGPAYFLGRNLVQAIHNSKPLVTYRVEDAGVGIWLQSVPHTIVETPALLYASECSNDPSILFVNPVTADEIVVLTENSFSSNSAQGRLCGSNKFVPLECAKHPCLCQPSPIECQSPHNSPGKKPDRLLSWADFMNEEYYDAISR